MLLPFSKYILTAAKMKIAAKITWRKNGFIFTTKNGKIKDAAILPDARSTAFLGIVLPFKKCLVPEVMLAIEPAKREVPKAIYGISDPSIFVTGRTK